MSPPTKLPLKVVPPLEHDFYKPDPGGGPKKVFQKVTPAFRRRLADELMTVADNLRESFAEFPDVPAVARVKVREDAIAKSHRPTNVLSTNTCPIIGAQGLGELLISVTKNGLDNLVQRIQSDTTNIGVANLSTLKAFSVYHADVSFPQDTNIKIKLFRHHRSDLDAAVDKHFAELARSLKLGKIEELTYSDGLKIYRIQSSQRAALEAIGRYVGTQSIGAFPLYRPVRSTAITVRAASPQEFPVPDAAMDYPVLGIIDSGTAANDPLLSPWRESREVYVAPSDQDNTHGSFVAGLVVHPRLMNHGDARFPSCSARFVDVVALSKNGTTEDKLLAVLEDAVGKYPKIKVWNLSLGTGTPIDNQSFSDLGAALDRLQREHGITFVIAAGNYLAKPFRGWPPEKLGEADRICAPADSLRSIVVGSLAHRDHASSRVKADHPSPFSRRGPGPLYLPKPDVSHWGGNCDANGACNQIGILSLDGRGNLSEDLGTSFATPLVSTVLANASHRLMDARSNLLSRALLIHSAALKGNKIDPSLLKYRGFGTPPDIEDIFGCDPWQCTLTFELEVEAAVAYEKAIFPMPPSLFVDADMLKANILMTLVHDPDMDASCGSEYCRSNIEVSLGTYDIGTDGKYHQRKKVPEDPKLKGKAFEKDLVEHGFKWSPVKVYRRQMVRGVKGTQWRLDLSVHHRSGHQSALPNRAALVITVSDPLMKAPVYNEMVAQMNKMGWSATDLQLKPRLRT